MPAATHEPLDPADLEEFAQHADRALRIDPSDGILPFLEQVGVERFRIARVEGRMAAGVGTIRSAHHVGGAAIPAALVTVVWAAPHVRGRGIASELVTAALEEQRAAGLPLASLFPANLAIYRRVGFEPAGLRYQYRVPLATMSARAPEGWTVEPLDGVTPQAPGPLAGLYEASLPRLGAVATRRVAALWHALLNWNEGGETAVALARNPAA